MRRAPILLFVLLLLVLGCTRPEVEAFRQRPGPVSVSVSLPSGLVDREAFQKEYASALRAHLATRVVVVPEGVRPPVGAAELQVDIRDMSPAPRRPDPATVGVAVGATVGALSAASGNRGWSVMDGLFWGLWAGSQAAMAQENTRDRLGYRPQVVRAQVRLVQPGNPEPLWTDAIEPAEVVEAMDPLPPGSRDDDGRIREEEAKGFARVVVQKLSSEFHWMRLTEQHFYQEPPAKKDEAPPPRPEPKSAPVPEPKNN